MDSEEEVYFKKVVSLNLGRGDQLVAPVLQFRVAQDLFSSQEVDIGTQRLLRSLTGKVGGEPFKVLDLGCGYGPLGLGIKRINPNSTIHLVDRDALAIEYSRQNAALNHLAVDDIYGSLGYDDVTRTDFDLVVSNIPGKAGEPVITSLLLDAAEYLMPGGTVAVVVVTPLEPLVAGILNAPGIEITFQKQWNGHTVFHYRFPGHVQVKAPQKALERGVYTRAKITASFQNLHFPMQTVYGLAEFDTLSYQSELMLEGILDSRKPDGKSILVLNPNQGHLPVALWKLYRPDTLTLVDRDLLSLRTSLNNLTLNGCPAQEVTLLHQPGSPSPEKIQADLVACTLREEEGPNPIAATVRGATALLSAGGIMLIVGSSTAITRLGETLQRNQQVIVKDRKRIRGQSLLVLRRK